MEEFGFAKSLRLRKAFQLRKQGKCQDAVTELELACREADNGQALFVKAEALMYGGFCLERNQEKAVCCFELSARAGCAWAMAWLGSTWIKGVFESKDAFACGWCSLLGIGVESNPKLGRELLLQASAEGNVYAMRYLALDSSPEECFLWNEQAGLAGDAVAQNWLGFYYRRGEGVLENNTKSFEWFSKASQQHHRPSLVCLARCYEKGIGCKQDLTKSALFYVMSGEPFHVHRRLEATYYDHSQENLQAWFVFGRELKKNAKLRDSIGSICGKAIQIYDDSVLAAQRAVFCFFWIFKIQGWLSRDTRKLVAEMVWESRCDPFLWKVGLANKDDLSKQKKIKFHL